MSEPQTTRIKQAAIKVGDDIWTLPQPARHHNILWAMHDVKNGSDPSQRPSLIEARGVQGFIDETGKFLTREAAWQKAMENRQFKGLPIHATQLFSEDLW